MDGFDIKDSSILVKTIKKTIDASDIISGVVTSDDANLVTDTITDSKNINTIKFHGNSYQIADTIARVGIEEIAEIVKKLQGMLEQPKMKSVSCMHCGAPLEMRFDDHIVKCGYCHSVYVIDTDMIRDVRCE